MTGFSQERSGERPPLFVVLRRKLNAHIWKTGRFGREASGIPGRIGRGPVAAPMRHAAGVKFLAGGRNLPLSVIKPLVISLRKLMFFSDQGCLTDEQALFFPEQAMFFPKQALFICEQAKKKDEQAWVWHATAWF
jgi:hypothetical protein